MRKLFLTFIILGFVFHYSTISAQTETKILDEGIVIPQGLHADIMSPIQGLLMYDTGTNSYWYFNGTAWTEIGLAGSGGNGGSKVQDIDNDTYVDVESSLDTDKIEFGLSGTKYFEMALINNNPVLRLHNSNNTIFGEEAGLNVTTGIENIFIGKSAGTSVTTGEENIAIGLNALTNTATQSDNIAIGNESLLNNGTGVVLNNEAYNNVAIGHRSMKSNVKGFSNVAIGNGALEKNIEGSRNVAVGYLSLNFTTDWYNVGLGRASGYNLTTGSSNTILGDQSGFALTTGDRNICIGRNAGYQLSTGNRNIAIGYDAGVQIANEDIVESVAIGYNAINTANNQVVLGNSSTTEICGYVDFTVHSDARIKENIQEQVSGLELIKKLRPVSYNVNYNTVAGFIGEKADDPSLEQEQQAKRARKSEQTQYGFIAQEVHQTMKDLDIEFQGVHVPTKEENLYSISYSSFVVPLVKAVQEIDEKNSRLEDENQGLKMHLESILARLAVLEAKE